MRDTWDIHFLKECLFHATMSKDPSSKVGAVVVGEDHEPLVNGYNGFARGIQDDNRLLNRDLKLKLIIHAEENAILTAARLGVRLKGSIMYSLGNSGGLLWGGPCCHCANMIIQAGIKRLVTTRFDAVPERWKDEMLLSKALLEEGGVEFSEVEFND